MMAAPLRPVTPRVSVIVPCYNHAHYLPEAVESIVRQTFRDWELIIIDDGSPDDTARVAEQLIARYPAYAIRLLRQPNSGLSASRNNAIRIARGDYILPLDADDQIEPTLLEQAVTVLDTHPEVGFVYTDVRLFGDANVILSSGAYNLARLRFDNFLHVASLFRKQAWAGTSGFCGSGLDYYEDWGFWLSLAEQGWQGWYIPQPLSYYRKIEGSMISHLRDHDLELRARIILNHAGLYEPAIVAWARKITSPDYSQNGVLRGSISWLYAFIGYIYVIIRYYPRLLPKTLLRPLVWRLSVRQQGYGRQLIQFIRNR